MGAIANTGILSLTQP